MLSIITCNEEGTHNQFPINIFSSCFLPSKRFCLEEGSFQVMTAPDCARVTTLSFFWLKRNATHPKDIPSPLLSLLKKHYKHYRQNLYQMLTFSYFLLSISSYPLTPPHPHRKATTKMQINLSIHRFIYLIILTIPSVIIGYILESQYEIGRLQSYSIGVTIICQLNNIFRRITGRDIDDEMTVKEGEDTERNSERGEKGGNNKKKRRGRRE